MLFNSQTAYWVLISVEERSAWGSLHTSAAHVWLFLICCLCRFVLINVLRTNTAQIFTYSPMSFCLISACLEMLIRSSILVEISYVLAFDSAFLFPLCLCWIEIKRKCWFFSCTLFLIVICVISFIVFLLQGQQDRLKKREGENGASLTWLSKRSKAVQIPNNFPTNVSKHAALLLRRKSKQSSDANMFVCARLVTLCYECAAIV